MIITIDGPAGSGKTTIARELARRLDFLYFDTGALYRAFTYFLQSKSIHSSNKKEILLSIPHFKFEILREKSNVKYLVNEEDVTQIIRNQEITDKVSEIAAIKEVREALSKLIRNFKAQDAIFEGRDMGSVVFPQADLKIFLSARASVRAERRYLEMKDDSTTQAEVEKKIFARDEKDSQREASPLTQPQGSHFIDTSDLSIDEIIELIMMLLPKRRP